MADMLVKLYDTDYGENLENPAPGISVRKSCVTDKRLILDFVSTFHGEEAWVSECEYAILNNPVSCYIAVHEKKIVGFACWDATAKGFFGPTGVAPECRGKGIGKALLLRSLYAMREYGYAYAVIGWVAGKAVGFYEHTVNAKIIEDSPPQKSIYSNMAGI